jgi:hypothetical protein
MLLAASQILWCSIQASGSHPFLELPKNKLGCGWSANILSLFSSQRWSSHMINFCMYFHMVIDYINFSNFLSGAVDYLCRVFATTLWCSLYQGDPWHMLSRACLSSNINTSTEDNIDHSDFLVLHIAEVHLHSNLCFNNWKLLGFRPYIFLSKLVDSFFCMQHYLDCSVLEVMDTPH